MQQMITINLLDWRETRREERQKQFLVALGVTALVCVGLVYLALSLYNSAIDNQQARNRYLQDQITQMNNQLKEIKTLDKKRNALINRMHVIDQLQQSRSEVVHYFDQIESTLPKGAHLTSLKQHGNSTTVKGIAGSNGEVSAYMVNLDASDWFADPRLIVIKSSKKGQRRFAHFTMTFTTTVPSRKDNDKDGK